PVTRDQLGRDYRALHERLGLTTVMVTHDVWEALLLADRILVLDAGKIVADGSPAEMLSRPADDRVRALMETPRRQAERWQGMAPRERSPSRRRLGAVPGLLRPARAAVGLGARPRRRDQPAAGGGGQPLGGGALAGAAGGQLRADDPEPRVAGPVLPAAAG